MDYIKQHFFNASSRQISEMYVGNNLALVILESELFCIVLSCRVCGCRIDAKFESTWSYRVYAVVKLASTWSLS
jgi:hypothetical protein